MSNAFHNGLALRCVQVADLIRQRIARGALAEGHQVPTLDALVRAFDVARVTVRQAIKLLAEEGLLSPQGRGTFVTRRPRQERFVSVFTTLSELSSDYQDTRPEVVNIEQAAKAPSFLAHEAGRQAER